MPNLLFANITIHSYQFYKLLLGSGNTTQIINNFLRFIEAAILLYNSVDIRSSKYYRCNSIRYNKKHLTIQCLHALQQQFYTTNKKLKFEAFSFVMKRSAVEMERLTYESAVKKAQLVERNPHPNGVNILDPLRVSMHNEEDIISLATQIQNADKQLKAGTCQKLCVILDQIKMLQAQAMQILKESDESQLLHNAACNFTKKPGHVYHLYQRQSGQSYFSMLSPEEWSGSVDQKYLGSYRLEFDLSWTPLDKMKERDEKMKWAEKCYATTSLAASPIPMAIDFGNDK